MNPVRWCLPAALAWLVCVGPCAAASTTPVAPATSVACKAGASDAKDVKLLGGEQFTASALNDKGELLAPLGLPAGVDAQRARVTLLQVRRDKVVDPAMAKRFSAAEALATGAGEGRFVQVRADAPATLGPGSYALLLQITHPCLAQPAHVSLALDRAGAALRPPGKLQLDLIYDWPVGDQGKATPTSVTWPAADAKASVAPRVAGLRESDWRSAEPRNIDARLRPTATPASAAGLTLSFNPTGFPFGTSTGKLELSSPDLPAPVVVDVEVRARLHAIWIPVIVTLGIALGLLVRERLPQFLALRAAQASGIEATKAFRAKVAPIEDRVFKAAVAAPLEALEMLWSKQARSWRSLKSPVADALAIAAAQEAARQAVDAAVADLTARLQAAQTEWRGLCALAACRDGLPPGLGHALDGLAAGLASASAAFAGQDATEAQAQIDQARRVAIDALRLEWSAWQQAYPALDADLQDLRALMDPRRDAARGFAAGGTLLAQRAHDLAPTLLATPDFSDLNGLAAALQAWRAQGWARATALRQWLGFLTEDAEALLSLVGTRACDGAALEAKALAFETAVDHLLGELRQALARPPAFEPVAVNPRPALEAAAALLRALVDACEGSGETRDKLHGLVDARQFFSAALGLKRSGARAFGAARFKSAHRPPGDDSDVSEPQTPPEQDLVPPAPLPPLDAAALEQLRTRATREILVAQRWTTAVVGVITLAVSYAFFRERFVGMPGEWLGLFFWGMSADLSAAGLTALQTGLATPPKKA